MGWRLLRTLLCYLVLGSALGKSGSAVDRIESPVCAGHTGGQNVGCVGESLIPKGKTYLVEFQHGESSGDPSVCWKTCQLVYKNTTLALVAWTQNTGLDCHCGMYDAVTEDMLGPDVFCDVPCNKHPNDLCGGSHTFKDGKTEQYFSAYCVPSPGEGGGSPLPGPPPPPPSTTPAPVPTTPPLPTNTPSSTDLLKDIWGAIVQSNIVNIVTIGLLVLIVILVLVLLTWTYLFMESYDPAASAAFYRKLSSAKKPLEPQQSTMYGATNGAFDPTPETNTEQFPSEPAPNPSEIVTKEGRSTFYRGASEDDASSQASGETELEEETKRNEEKQ